MANESTSRDPIDYGALQQRLGAHGVVRAALEHAAARGLPGEYHFIITFRRRAEGVAGPKKLLAKYPDKMKIVLQHQYRDLVPGEASFSVTLSFGGQLQTLSIPYAAIVEFQDPSVGYSLHVSDEPLVQKHRWKTALSFSPSVIVLLISVFVMSYTVNLEKSKFNKTLSDLEYRYHIYPNTASNADLKNIKISTRGDYVSDDLITRPGDIGERNPFYIFPASLVNYTVNKVEYIPFKASFSSDDIIRGGDWVTDRRDLMSPGGKSDYVCQTYLVRPFQPDEKDGPPHQCPDVSPSSKLIFRIRDDPGLVGHKVSFTVVTGDSTNTLLMRVSDPDQTKYQNFAVGLNKLNSSLAYPYILYGLLMLNLFVLVFCYALHVRTRFHRVVAR